MRVLVACEFSGTVRDAFAARGHDAMSCDLLESETPGNHYQGDIRIALSSLVKWDLLIAHPTCTRLTNSGVRWLTGKKLPRRTTRAQLWRDLDAACEFYKVLRNANIPRIAIENPVMHKYAKERLGNVPRQIVQPWYFGDPFFKATGFELKNLPLLVDTNRLVPPKPGTAEHKAWSAVHRASPGPDRWKERSRTLPGIAAAMAEQWGGNAND